MASSIAFGLRAEYDGTVQQGDQTVPVFTGGVITVDDTDFNVREALDDGGGTITAAEDNAALVRALDAYPALKRVPVPSGADPITDLDGMNVTQLRARARERGVSAAGSADDLRQRLLEGDPQASGDLGRAGKPDTPSTEGSVT